ncbi:MAG: PilZ domain-containing protein [Gammaproteobacteria bacterium]|nr:PilZ domain-containing protein [Gammaproteobacteria bacterium]
MFWKKKPQIDLQEDPKHPDNRAAFRISPDEKRPIILTIGGSQYRVLNISGTGVCFRSDIFHAGSMINAMVRIPSEDKIFQVKLSVISNQNSLCRCSFIDIHIGAQDLLHAYILDLQKKKIRRNQSS